MGAWHVLHFAALVCFPRRETGALENMGRGHHRALACPWGSEEAAPALSLLPLNPVGHICCESRQHGGLPNGLSMSCASSGEPLLSQIVSGIDRASSSFKPSKGEEKPALWPPARARGQYSVLASMSPPDQSVGSSAIL